ncbi:MAG: nucleotide pyrophosphohydrolase [Clostridiales bacterium]
MNEELQKQILAFRDDRNWSQFHNPKDLAISISLEAAELLENFQWSGSETEVPQKREEIAEELADVLIYGVLMCDAMGFDIDEIMAAKLGKNNQKYPVAKAYGSKKKYTELSD